MTHAGGDGGGDGVCGIGGYGAGIDLWFDGCLTPPDEAGQKIIQNAKKNLRYLQVRGPRRRREEIMWVAAPSIDSTQNGTCICQRMMIVRIKNRMDRTPP